MALEGTGHGPHRDADALATIEGEPSRPLDMSVDVGIDGLDERELERSEEPFLAAEAAVHRSDREFGALRDCCHGERFRTLCAEYVESGSDESIQRSAAPSLQGGNRWEYRFTLDAHAARVMPR